MIIVFARKTVIEGLSTTLDEILKSPVESLNTKSAGNPGSVSTSSINEIDFADIFPSLSTINPALSKPNFDLKGELVTVMIVVSYMLFINNSIRLLRVFVYENIGLYV